MIDPSNECTWPEVKARAHYLGWLGAALTAAVLLGLTVDLLVVLLTGGEVGWEIIPLLYLCTIVPPAVYGWRKYGEAFCGFLELEHALDEAIARADRSSAHAEFIADLVRRIEAARGMDRQIVRNEAKAWLLAHASQLTRDEREYVTEHLGYL